MLTQFKESRPVTTTPTRSSVATCSSAGSELELLLPQQRQEHQREKQSHSPNNDVDALIAHRYAYFQKSFSGDLKIVDLRFRRQYPVATARRLMSNVSPQELDDQRSRKLSPNELLAKRSITER